jgi:hypothetical protein
MKFKTILSIVLFIPLAGFLLVTLACLPVPVGDPETAKIDPELTGAWQAIPPEGGDAKNKMLVTMRPYDTHTYFLQFMALEVKEGKEQAVVASYKSWLTSLGGATFLVAEPLDNSDFLTPGAAADRYYWVGKLERAGETATLSALKETSPLLKDIKTREQAETVIKANVNNKDLYETTTMKFKKLGKDGAALVNEIRTKAAGGAK